MRTPHWLLLATALGLLSSVGCESNAPSTPSTGGKEDGDTTNPSMSDDGTTAGSSVDAGAKPVSAKPKDAGTVTKPSAAIDASVLNAKDKDAGTSTGASPAGNSEDAGATDSKDASSPATTTGGGSLPPVDSVDKDGPFETTIDKNAGANSWVFRPKELGKGGVKHPVFVWGTGATASPNDYAPDMPRIASHGFIVISPNSTMVSADMLKASLDWILAQNDAKDSMYFQKIETSKVAMGGHSLGSVGTFDAEATETRLTTTIHIAGGSFDGMGSSKVKTPTAYICGGSGDIAQPQCATDFMNATKPTFYSVLTGVGHVDAFKNALPGMIAWLRWHLAGETDRKAMFTGPDGDFFKGIWKSQTKNW